MWEAIFKHIPPRDFTYGIIIAGLVFLNYNSQRLLRDLCMEVRENSALLKQIFPIIIYRGRPDERGEK